MFKKTVVTAAMLMGLVLGSAAVASAASAHGPDGYIGGYGTMGRGYGMMGPPYGPVPGYSMMGSPYAMGPGYGMRRGYGVIGPGYGMGPRYGMMGPGFAMGPNMRGPGFGTWAPVKVNLTVDDVRTNFQHWLAWQGNPRLKLGTVKKDSNDTIVAEIVTKDGSLVDRYRVNRSTGAIWRTE